MNKTKKCKKFLSILNTKKKRDKTKLKLYKKEAENFLDNKLINVIREEIDSHINIAQDFPLSEYNRYKYKIEIKKNSNYEKIFYCDNKSQKLLIDFEKDSKQSKFYNLGSFKLSSNEEYLAYCVDKIGNEVFDIYLKKYDEVPKKIISNCSENFNFSIDSKSIYYLSYNNINLQVDKLFKYDIHSKKSKLIYHETKEINSLDIHSSSDNSEIILNVGSYLKSTPYVIKNDKLIKLYDSKNYNWVTADRWMGIWYFLNMNKDKSTIEESSDLINYKTILVNKPNYEYENLIIKAGYLLIEVNDNQINKLLVVNICNKKKYEINLSFNKKYTISYSYVQNLNIYDPCVSFIYSTFISPSRLIKFNLNNKKICFVKNLGKKNFNSEQFSEKLIKINSNVFITVLSKKNLKSHFNPCLLYGYGSYGVTIKSEFDPLIVSLLNRGFLYCVAHIRGGSFQGYKSWRDGKKLKKKNTFTDFIVAAEWLIKNKFTTPDQLRIWGRSAGGLLIGNVINQRPDLFKLAILGVPWVEVVDTMKDKCMPLTTIEYEEWGNPSKKSHLNYMKSYDPILNIDYKKNYPNVYIYSNVEDILVPYYKVLKYYEKLKKSEVFQSQKKYALLDVDLKFGHGQGTSKNDISEKLAKLAALIIKA